MGDGPDSIYKSRPTRTASTRPTCSSPTTARDALAAYKGWIASGGGNSGNVASQGDRSKPVTGVSKRIGWNLVAGTSTYYISIVGDSHTYTVTCNVYDSLALVQAGDTVTLSYIESKEAQEAVTAFSDPSVK